MTVVTSDNPIQMPKDDQLGRTPVAAAIAADLRHLDVSQGTVVGLFGPWGSGKTSLMNLIRYELAEPPSLEVLEFNPWLFSGADQLIDRFFVELAAQLRLGPSKFQTVADELAAYGEVIAPLHAIPVFGSWIAMVSDTAKAVKKLREKRRGGIAETRKRLADNLTELEVPIVVVIDDIDRLNANEIREVFKLVRLTANFPNILYLIAFDRLRVEQALEDEGLPGRNYLEKIVQVGHDIPVIPEAVLDSQIFAAIDEALATIDNTGSFNQTVWPDIFYEIVRPLVRNMRDVRRYAASVQGTARGLEGKVELVDVLGLEAVRVCLPDLFAAIPLSRQALTSPEDRNAFGDLREEQRKTVIDTFIASADERHDVATALIKRVFPAAIHHIRNESSGPESLPVWLHEHRVAHPDVLNFYLERVAGTRLEASWKAEQAIGLLHDGDRLDAYLRSFDASQWQDIIHNLEAYEDAFPVEAAVPATIVLLNLMGEMPESPRAISDVFDPRRVVKQMVYRMLRRLPSVEAVEAAVHSIMPDVSTLSGKLALLQTVGHEEYVGHELVSNPASEKLESSLRAEIRTATAEALAKEPHLYRLISWAKRSADPAEQPLEIPRSFPLYGALLKNAVGSEQSQTMGTRFVETEKVLPWDNLVDLVGGEDAIRQYLESCPDHKHNPSLSEAIDLAQRYLDGGNSKSLR